jgi:hypothetical protein
VKTPYVILIICAGMAWLASPAFASFHRWLPEEAFSNASGSVQFIEFSDAFAGEEFLTETSLQSNANNFIFGANLPSSSTNGRNFLVGTAAFAALPGAPAPDYTIPSNFFSTTADSLFLNGTIQPHLTFTAGQLPTDGIHSLFFNGASLSTGLDSPTNFSGVSGNVTVPEPASVSLVGIVVVGLMMRRRGGGRDVVVRA